MKKILAAMVLAVALAIPVATMAQTIRYAYASEQLTVSSTAVPFTATKVNQTNTNKANEVTFTVGCASGTTCVLRFRIDGGTPTAALGHRALYGDTVTITGHGNNVNFKGIRETSTDVVLDVSFLR